MYRKDTLQLPKYKPERVMAEMMGELIMALLTAGCRQDKERAYRNLERAGIDRKTADMMAAEFYKEQGGGNGEYADGCAR